MIIANMQTEPWKPWLPRLAAFAVALLLAASVVYWAMRWPSAEAGAGLPPPLAHEDLPAASVGQVARLLGAAMAGPQAEAPGAPEAGSRFRLTGVLGLGSGQGVALVSVDGKPSKAYPVGSKLDEGWVVQSVGPRTVALGEQAAGASRLKLELPVGQPALPGQAPPPAPQLTQAAALPAPTPAAAPVPSPVQAPLPAVAQPQPQ